MDFRKVLALRGPNIWANFFILEAWLDLGELKAYNSHNAPGFRSRLMTWLPSLAEHRCSLGEPGGFLQQLETGTLLAHVLQHVVLELQSLAGTGVSFGRVQDTSEAGVFKIAVEYKDETVARTCLDAGKRLVLAAVHGQPFDIVDELAKLRELAYDVCLGPSTASIVQAAKVRGIPFRRLNSGSLVMLGYGSKQRRICTAETDRTSAIAESIAQDKELTRKLLKAICVPVPDGRPVENAEDAWEAAEEIGVPVVVKPQCGNHGRGVATNLFTKEQVMAAYQSAREEERKIVVEKYATGEDYRVLIVNNKLVAAARREPPKVTGDGKLTISQLVDQVNKDPRRSDGHATSLSYIKLDAIAQATLVEQGFTPDSVPAAGQVVLIRRNANLSTGGTATDVTDEMHPTVVEHAIDAARMIGLDIAGIDIIAQDISRPLVEQGGIICEVNAGPGLRMHIDPSEGKPRPVGEAIVASLFPDGNTGRVPIVAITGVNGKTTTTRLVAHILGVTGKCVGMTCTDGVYIGSRRIDTGDCSGPKSAQAVLLNPQVEAAVFETARGGILREGLAYDRVDVAVVTNIGEGDHLGLSDIDTLEKLAKVKRVIVDVVPPDGAAALNAADPLVAAMAAHCRGSVVFFDRNSENPLLAQRRAEGGRVVFVRDNALFLADGATDFPLLALERIPLTHGGLVGFQVENVLAATAACWALGTPAEVIRTGLESFISSLGKSPGRFNLFDINGATAIVDYGHNPSSLLALLEIIEKFPHQNRLALYSAAGDRRDVDLIRQGEIIGEAFDKAIIYEDHYLRGRQPGEIIRLFREGLQKGSRVKETQEITGWQKACETAIQMMKAGDLWLIQADVVDETVNYLRSLVTTDIAIREVTLHEAMKPAGSAVTPVITPAPLQSPAP